MKDRVPALGKANRVKITQDNGQVVEGVLSYADDAIVQGDALNKANLLTDKTAGALGLGQENPTVNDAFEKLSIPKSGTGTLYVHCKDNAGGPVSGCVVQIGDELAVTGAIGAAKFFLAPGTYSVEIRSPIDYGAEAHTKSVAVALSDTKSIEATIQDSLDGATELRLTSSIPPVAFSDRVTSADVFGVGGGGGGGCAYGDDNPAVGAGGAGGKTAMKTGIDPTKILSITVGAAGKGSTHTTTTSTKSVSDNGTAGGKTSVDTSDGINLISADGGSGGNGRTTYQPYITGASGGSGSGGIAGSQTTSEASEVGASGEDGADGARGGTSSSSDGGTGQGSTTRCWHEPDGELFSSAGGSAVTSTLGADKSKTGTPGRGAGEGLALYRDSSGVGGVEPGGTYVAGNATTYGSGGGGLAIRVKSSMANTVTSGNGMQGLVVFRWEVAA